MCSMVPLLIVIGFTNAAYEAGETCYKHGVAGVCVSLGHCQTAINDLLIRRNPQICTFDNATPIVCCLDSLKSVAPATAPPNPVATTTWRSSTTTTEYYPDTYEYEYLDQAGQCEPIPTSLTSPRTEQKAWNKCLEYQEQLVYPCERGTALGGELSRSNRCQHNADILIVGGHSAAAHEFPHMVMLGYGDQRNYLQWLCGGTLISDRYVLTAGHCIGDSAIGPVNFVLVGALRRSDSADDSKIYKVKRIIKHPDYKHFISKYNDIALLETETQIQLDQYTVPACLYVGDPVDDSRASATGWGLTAFGGSVSENLQTVILSKFTTQECAAMFPVDKNMKNGFNATTQVCYGDKNKTRDTCQGDSGGPLQVKSKNINCMYVIIGVTSFGRACGIPGSPGIYTRVAAYVPWIESVVWP